MNFTDRWQRLHQNRPTRTLQLLIATAVTVDYSLSYNINSILGGWFYVLPLILVLIVLLLPVGPSVEPHAKVLLLSLYYAITATLLIFLADIFGPYFQLLILVLFVAIIWYGLRGLFYGLLLSYLIISFALLQQFTANAFVSVSQIVLYVAGLTILGVLFERVTAKYETETKKKHEASQSYYFERTRLLSLINSMADAVIATDKTGKISLYNGATLELFDTNETLHERSVRTVLKPLDESGNQVDILSEAIKNHAAIIRDDLHFIAHDGSRVDIYISVSPVSSAGSDRETTGFIMVLRDITKQKTLDEQRDEFISVASHELRTPIAIAEANISTAMLPKFADKLTDEGRKLLKQAHDNVIFLGNLINDLHVLAQAEQGRLDIKVEKMDPEQLINDLADNYREEAAAKGLKLIVDVNTKVKSITTSVDAIREVMQNFVTNAIKYTEKGKITLRVTPDKEGDGVVFSVTDTGIGISNSDQKHVFEKFYRSEDYRTRQSGGTGLGLYIIKSLIDRLGGRLWFESKLNKGSTFYCAIPASLNIKQDKS